MHARRTMRRRMPSSTRLANRSSSRSTNLATLRCGCSSSGVRSGVRPRRAWRLSFTVASQRDAYRVIHRTCPRPPSPGGGGSASMSKAKCEPGGGELDQKTPPAPTLISFASTLPLQGRVTELAARSGLLLVFQLADVVLRVKLHAELRDEIELRLEEVDVVLLVGHQLLEQVARDEVLHRIAVGRGLLVERARADFGLQVGVEDLLDVLSDVQRIEHLHVGEALQEDDAVDELVGVLHLLDRFLAPLLGEVLVAPVVEQPVMQPVLIDRGQLAAQALVEIVDDLGVALHGPRSLRWQTWF